MSARFATALNYEVVEKPFELKGVEIDAIDFALGKWISDKVEYKEANPHKKDVNTLKNYHYAPHGFLKNSHGQRVFDAGIPVLKSADPKSPPFILIE